jgi:hypothetical protein
MRRWHAQIKFQGKSYSLGHFDTPEIAAAEYDKGAKLLFRKFARTNEQIERQIAGFERGLDQERTANFRISPGSLILASEPLLCGEVQSTCTL